MPGDLIAVGKVVKVWGVRGEVKVIAFSGDYELWADWEALYVGDEKNAERRLRIRKFTPMPGSARLLLEGYDTPEAARELVNTLLWVERSLLPELAADEYYWTDLIGLAVYDRQGNAYGPVKTIIDSGAHEIYVSEKDGREYLIPAIKSVVKEIDLKNKRIVIDPLPGLFDHD